MAVLAHPFNEILNEHVLVKTIYEQPHVGVAMGKDPNEMRDNHKRVCARILGVQFLQHDRLFPGAHVDRVVKMKQERLQVILGRKVGCSHLGHHLNCMRRTIRARQIHANAFYYDQHVWQHFGVVFVLYFFGQRVKEGPGCRPPYILACHFQQKYNFKYKYKDILF